MKLALVICISIILSLLVWLWSEIQSAKNYRKHWIQEGKRHTEYRLAMSRRISKLPNQAPKVGYDIITLRAKPWIFHEGEVYQKYLHQVAQGAESLTFNQWVELESKIRFEAALLREIVDRGLITYTTYYNKGDGIAEAHAEIKIATKPNEI